MIAVVDYGAGNLRSVELALERLGEPPCITRNPDELLAADGVILPGVGAFSEAMQALAASGVIPALQEVARQGTPLLGICLGMQALFEGSEEGPGVQGLGLIPGRVRRLPDCGLKIPHMGWNHLVPAKGSPLLKGLPEQPYVYFVHSFACEAADAADVLTVTSYGVAFHSAVQRGNVMGMQFHPEKSGKAGAALLRNFLSMTRKEGR